jgi:hypothetical protein
MSQPLPHKEIEFPDVDASGQGDNQVIHWQWIRNQWQQNAIRYESDPGSFCNSWHYLNCHPAFWRFMCPERNQRFSSNHVTYLQYDYGFGSGAIEVDVQGDDDVVLEAGQNSLQRNEHGIHEQCHDYDLDTSASSYEEAVIILAWKVWERYGNDRRILEFPDAV